MALALEAESVRESAQHRKVSFEEFLRWDGAGKHLEWVNGRVIEMPPPDDRHIDINAFLIALLRVAAENAGIGVIRGETALMRLPERSSGRSPDLMLIRSENLGRVTARFVDGPADLVVEIVSPSSFVTDYVEKALEYARAGVPEYWIIDPLAGRSAFLVLGDDRGYRESALDEQGRHLSPALNGLAVDPAWFLADPLPKVTTILKEWGLV